MSQITQVLNAIERGDPSAAEQLLPLVYDELRKLAAAKMAQEVPGQTLQATALVHEAYMRILGNGREERSWDNQGHFFAAAAEAMRRILIEIARQKHCQKRGAQKKRISIDAAVELSVNPSVGVEDLLALDEALAQLEDEDPVKAQLVKLRYFAGMTLEEASRALGISVATSKRYWIYARAWLYGRIAGQ